MPKSPHTSPKGINLLEIQEIGQLKDIPTTMAILYNLIILILSTLSHHVFPPPILPSAKFAH